MAPVQTLHASDLLARMTHEDGEAVVISVEIANVGRHSGAEVVQLYVAMPEAAQAPPKQLKDFRKVWLESGAHTRVWFRLQPGELAVFDGRWSVHPGRYTALVGRSSRDIRTRIDFEKRND